MPPGYLLLAETPFGPLTAWHNADSSDPREEWRIHVTIPGPGLGLVNPFTGKEGLHLVFDGKNQRSCDYNPGVFNALRHAMLEAGVTKVPEAYVDEHPRALAARVGSFMPREIKVPGGKYRFEPDH